MNQMKKDIFTDEYLAYLRIFACNMTDHTILVLTLFLVQLCMGVWLNLSLNKNYWSFFKRETDFCFKML